MTGASETRWSRRRAAVRAEAEAEQRATRDGVVAARRTELEQKSDEEILRELSLKDPGAMGQGDDFAAFMRKEVPERLRRRALRVLWRSNPVLACVDELLDYGDDFKAEAAGGGVIATAYRVGRGMLAHVEEMRHPQAPDGPTAPESAPESTPESTPESAPERAARADRAGDVDAAGADDGVARTGEAASEPDPDLGPTPEDGFAGLAVSRRMRFEFGGAA